MPLDARDAVLVAFARVQLDLEVPDVPDPDGLVGGAGGQNDVGAQVEGDAVDVVGMRVFHDARGLGIRGLPQVENLQCAVVRHCRQHPGEFVVELDAVDGGVMVRECALRFDLLLAARVLLDVPDLDGLVVGAGRDLPFHIRVPVQGEALFCVAFELYVWRHGACGLGGVLCAVEDQRAAVWRHGRNQVRVLRHVPCFVHLAGMINLLRNRELHLRLVLPPVAPQFPTLLIVVLLGQLDLRNTDMRNLEGVGRAAVFIRVRAEEKAVDGAVFAGRALDVGEPLRCQGRPVERAGQHDVVEERGMLFPDFVLLVDDLLAHDGAVSAFDGGGRVDWRGMLAWVLRSGEL